VKEYVNCHAFAPFLIVTFHCKGMTIYKDAEINFQQERLNEQKCFFEHWSEV